MLTSRTLSAVIAALVIASAAAPADAAEGVRLPARATANVYVPPAEAFSGNTSVTGGDYDDLAGLAIAPTRHSVGSGTRGAAGGDRHVPVAPTRPAHPRPIDHAARSAPTGGDAGVDWTAIAFPVAAALLAIGALAAFATRRRDRATA
jgi:hypothetical protein